MEFLYGFKGCKILFSIQAQSKMETEDSILFYYEDKPFGYFSNFYQSPFTVGEAVYKTNQHFFQSKKFEGQPQEKLVIDAATPRIAFDLGQKEEFPRRKDWQFVKEDVMYEGLKHKFTTHKDLYEKLMASGDKKLIEHTKNDKYWADGGDGSGKNRLGVLLMRLREGIQEIKS